jgi:imidazole glycerol-phosphate synthase subunit HisH
VRIGIIDYGLGNLTSVAGAVTRLEHEPFISSNATELATADKLILPGVGAFRDGMKNLGDRGLIGPLTEIILEEKKPILGICLGSQLLANGSEEFGDHEGLGWIDAQVKRFSFEDGEMRVPHVGWNDLYRTGDSMLFEGLPETPMMYYVHSYYISANDPEMVIGECDYGHRFVAAIMRDNIYATQFHPEKSQADGLALLRNFVEKA